MGQIFGGSNIGVPGQDSLDNETLLDVIGNKTDTSFSDGATDPSIVGHLRANFYHVHDSSRVFPRTDDDNPLGPVNIASASGTWNFGSWTQVIAASTIAYMFDMHFVILGTISESDDYVLQLGFGGSGSEVFWGECAFTRDTNQMRASWQPIQGPPVAAETRISARLASATGSNNVYIKIYNHTYPPVT